jgi:hypothetical protein
MYLEGRRRGGAKDLSKHLLKSDENEFVKIFEIKGFSFDAPIAANLEKALAQMETVGFGKRDKRNIYHGILAPAYNCNLNVEQKHIAIDYYLENTHGLMRRIEDKQKLSDLRRKFAGIDSLPFEPHAKLVKERRANQQAQSARRKIVTSRGGKSFIRSIGFAPIAEQFGSIRSVLTKPILAQTHQSSAITNRTHTSSPPSTMPIRPKTGGWHPLLAAKRKKSGRRNSI